MLIVLTHLDCFLPYCCFLSIFIHALIFFVVVVYKCHVAFSLNFILLSLLESVFVSNSVLHTPKNPSSIDVIYKFDVYSHPLTKVSHGT